VSDTAILLTGVGKRYDIVSAFAQHATVVAADPNPLAPAQYAAHHRIAVPRIDDPAYVPALRALCERHSVKAVVPLTDLKEPLSNARACLQVTYHLLRHLPAALVSAVIPDEHLEPLDPPMLSNLECQDGSPPDP